MTLIHITRGAPQEPPDNSYIPKFVQVEDQMAERFELESIITHLNGREWFKGLGNNLLLPALGCSVDFQKLYDNSSFLGNFASDYKKDFVVLDVILRGAWVKDIQRDLQSSMLIAHIVFDKMETIS